jgi:hypothetical protein
VQQLNSTEEEMCREWRWHTEHKKNRRTDSASDVSQKGSVAERETRCSRTVRSRVSHC